VIHFASQGFQDSEIAELQQAAASGIDDFDFEKSHVIACQSHDLPPPLAATECILPFWIDRSHIGWMGVGPKILGGLILGGRKKASGHLEKQPRGGPAKCQVLRRNQAAEYGSYDKKNQLESTVKRTGSGYGPSGRVQPALGKDHCCLERCSRSATKPASAASAKA